MSETLTERDLRGLLAVVEEGRRDALTEGLPWATLEELARLVRCDCLSFPEADVVHGFGLFEQWLEPDDRGLEFGDSGDPEPPEYWTALRQFLPCTYAGRTGDLSTVVRWSDFYSRTELRNQPLYADFFAAVGTTHGLHASLPALPGHFRKVTFWRSGGPEFSERDRLVVELLRPHLWELFLESQRRLRRVPELTPREWEVLALTDQGYGNRDIARELFISVGTVRKHLEHIYDRTGTRTRGAAAALMMPHQPAAALPGRTQVPGWDV
jgi:DNA-binding CsgD family transcriptional regulator